jgi:hypothetical protein
LKLKPKDLYLPNKIPQKLYKYALTQTIANPTYPNNKSISHLSEFTLKFYSLENRYFKFNKTSSLFLKFNKSFLPLKLKSLKPRRGRIGSGTRQLNRLLWTFGAARLGVGAG